MTDDYSVTLPHIAGSSPNGKDASGNAVTGFTYWDFAFPTLATMGSSVSFGGSFGSMLAFGASLARWGDAANPAGWSVPWTVLALTPLP